MVAITAGDSMRVNPHLVWWTAMENCGWLLSGMEMVSLPEITGIRSGSMRVGIHYV